MNAMPTWVRAVILMLTIAIISMMTPTAVPMAIFVHAPAGPAYR
jgi:hypothetical protein